MSFLESSRDSDGLWRDFETLAGASSDWVSAFVCYATRGVPNVTARAPVLVSLLRRQRSNGGWSYNRRVPSDADSTSWALLALARQSIMRPSAYLRARQYLLEHQDGSGGFSTYSERDRIDRFIEVPDASFTRGWLRPHPCVTSLAARALVAAREPRSSPAVRAAVAYLRASRGADALWTSYWWVGPYYNTAAALHTLLSFQAIDRDDARATVRSVIDRQHDDGAWDEAAFYTALAILTLALVPTRSALAHAERGARWLLEQQRADGSWETQPILRIPPPMVEDAASVERWTADGLGTGVVVTDARRVFTTAAATWALTALSAMI